MRFHSDDGFEYKQYVNVKPSYSADGIFAKSSMKKGSISRLRLANILGINYDPIYISRASWDVITQAPRMLDIYYEKTDGWDDEQTLTAVGYGPSDDSTHPKPVQTTSSFKTLNGTLGRYNLA